MGYKDALDLAAQKLALLPTAMVCENCGVHYRGGEYVLPWLGSERVVSSGSEAHQILWLHYLAANGEKKPTGRLMAYREFAAALFYETKFHQRAVKPLVECFGKCPKRLVETARGFSGREEVGIGSASTTINVLPYLPLTFIIWEGDDELSPEGNILFDQVAKSWFAAEDLAVLASLAAYELIGASKN